MPRKLRVISESDADAPWFKDGLRFTCTECGNCCTGGPGYVWISDEEVDRLAAHLKLSREETLQKHCRTIHGRLSLKERRDEKGKYPCVFLIDRGEGKFGCGIYHARPLQCRTFPFWDSVIDTPGSWKRTARDCPGIDAPDARTFTAQQIVALRDAEDWPERAETPTSG